MWNARNVMARLSRCGLKQLCTSRAAVGCRQTNKMQLNIHMQGWYAVIVGDKCVAAFVEYEDALRYRKTIASEGVEIIIERISHQKG